MPVGQGAFVYGPFRVDRLRLWLALLLLAVALGVVVLADRRTDIRCEKRPDAALACTLQPRPLSPTSATFTLREVTTTREARRVGRHHTHWFGKLRALDDAGGVHETLLLPHAEAEAVTEALREFESHAEPGQVFFEQVSVAHGQLVLAPLLVFLAIWLAVHALRGSGRISLRLADRGRLIVTGFFCGLPLWRRTYDVRRTSAVGIEWDTAARPYYDAEFGRLWLRTANAEECIPGAFMRGRLQHGAAAAALRQLLDLPEFADVLLAPARTRPSRSEQLSFGLAAAALGGAIGLVAGLLASTVSGIESASENQALALYLVGAGLGALVGVALQRTRGARPQSG
ncbi:MAG: hypothetical protein QM756_32980 [Polyangiaceae bacterium]